MALLLYRVCVLLADAAPPAAEPAPAPCRDRAGPEPAAGSRWAAASGSTQASKRLIIRAQGRAPRGAARAPALPEGDQGARGDPRHRRPAPPDPRRAAPDRRRAGPPGPVPPQVRAPHRHRRSPSSCSGRPTARPHRADARQWVKDEKTRKPLAEDWVFAGSELFKDPITKKTIYAADEGDLITVANFGSAILDLPFASSASDADRVFSANTEQVPPLGTEVLLRLRPGYPATGKSVSFGTERCPVLGCCAPSGR